MAIAIDPVCGMEVDTETSDLSFEYEGTTYWFCGRGCLLEFKDDPTSYLSSDQPTRRCRHGRARPVHGDKSQLSAAGETGGRRSTMDRALPDGGPAPVCGPRPRPARRCPMRASTVRGAVVACCPRPRGLRGNRSGSSGRRSDDSAVRAPAHAAHGVGCQPRRDDRPGSPRA